MGVYNIHSPPCQTGVKKSPLEKDTPDFWCELRCFAEKLRKKSLIEKLTGLEMMSTPIMSRIMLAWCGVVVAVIHHLTQKPLSNTVTPAREKSPCSRSLPTN